MSVLVTHDHLRVLFLYVTLRLGTLDATSVVEWLTPETNISHQVYRRVWPTTQREALFWSTIQHHPSDDDEGPDYWIVVNHSTEHEHVPVRTLFLDSSSLVFSCTSALPIYVFNLQIGSKMVRLRLNVAMICQTIVNPPENAQLTRENITCKIQYSANGTYGVSSSATSKVDYERYCHYVIVLQ